MKLFDDLKYIGNNTSLSFFDEVWHCTCFVTRASTEKMELVIQQPHIQDGIIMGYTNLDAYVISEEELYRDFRLVLEDGTLQDMTPTEEEKREDEERLKKITEHFDKIIE